MSPAEDPMKIVIECDGSYRVEGNIPLVRKTQVVSEYGEPIAWQKEETILTEGTYWLCRCGQSKDFPFCDSTHAEIGFDGSETADRTPTADRSETYPGSHGIEVRRDFSLCMNAGFCGLRDAGIEMLAAQTGNTRIRSLVMAMIERCPSGSLTYALPPDGAQVEPDLPRQIALVTEITSSGPIQGPLWVTGGIPIESSEDGEILETRNRVTLCNCGHSRNKPFCDGQHRIDAERKARARR